MKVGILGGGQLAQMLALSAYPLGIEVICIDPKEDAAAKNITTVIQANFSETNKIKDQFHGIDCFTYETENLPIEQVSSIADKYKLFPTLEALKITQDRLYEKNFLNQLNIPTTEYTAPESWNDVVNAVEKFGFPFIFKTRRNGYDGKGQALIHNWEETKSAWDSMCSWPLIIEKFISFDFEVSMIAVRNQTGEILFYPLILNQHRKGILITSQAPFVENKLKLLAEKYALSILEKFNYVGVMTIEFFVLKDKLIANEIAPRVHNSGHWTIEGAETSQFENHLRAILGLPLGSTKSRSFCTMINLIGNKIENIQELLKIPGLHYHWYGKQPMPNRKLGHVTLCADDKNELAANTKKASSLLTT